MVSAKRKRTSYAEEDLTVKAGATTIQTRKRSEPNDSPSGIEASETRHARRGLRSSPSLQDVSSQEKAKRSLRASPGLIAVDGPTPRQLQAKKARLNESTSAKGSTFANQVLSQHPFSQPTLSLPPTWEIAGPPMASVAAAPTPASPVAESSTPKSKGKGRKRKGKEKEPPEEKRAARFKVKCPQNIMDRVRRVWQQRLFMIDRSRSGDELREMFSVLGSTGNVYTVVIDQVPGCSCPDALKGNHCKHILFIFLKVLRVPESSSHWYQKALLTSELAEIFAQAPLAPNCVAQQHVRDAHARARGQNPESGSSSSSSIKKRMPTEEDNCPICYETMYGVDENTLKFCEACGNALHDECWKQWQASSVRSGKTVTCVWCRAETTPAGQQRSQYGGYANEGYLNLGDVAGCSPTRDTSTYHGRARKYYH